MTTPEERLLSVQRNQAKKRGILQAIKLERGCADCGYNEHPAALDFDHRPGEEKLLLLGRDLSKYGINRLLAEAEKCDVVCANCHRIRTSVRGQHIVLRKPRATLPVPVMSVA
jgi:hypothetical protein